MSHADDMAALADTPSERQTILSIKGTKSAADKAAIFAKYKMANPGAEMSRFTARLTSGG